MSRQGVELLPLTTATHEPVDSSDETPILVLPPRRYLEQQAVEKFWRAKGWPVVRLARPEVPGELPRERVRLYGDYSFCVTVARALNVELVSPKDDLLLRIPEKWSQRTVRLSTLGDLSVEAFPLFIKSLAPKLMPAQVYKNLAGVVRFAEGLPPETPILLEAPVNFLCEARCLVLNNEILSCSVYEGRGDVNEAATFTRGFLVSIGKLDPSLMPISVVLDVGVVEGKGWVIVEANAVWGSGLNGCDPSAMASCVMAATRPKN